MADITISKDETVELDTLIKESGLASDPVNYDGSGTNLSDKFNVSGIQTHTTILNPKEVGTHDININGQILTIKVEKQSTIPNTVVSRWKVDEGTSSTLYDNINSNNGNISGGTWIENSDRFGGWQLDISDGDYVDFGNPSNIDPSGQSEFTVAITFNSNQRGQIFGKRGSSSNDNVLIYETDSGLGGYYDIGSESSSNNGVEWTNYLSDTLYRVVLTFDGNTIYLYVNGNEKVTLDASGTIANGSNNWKVGNNDGSYNWSGSIDDPLIDPTYWEPSTVEDDYNRQLWS